MAAGDELLSEIRMAAGRISEIVGAVKSYAFLDQALDGVANVDRLVHDHFQVDVAARRLQVLAHDRRFIEPPLRRRGLHGRVLSGDIVGSERQCGRREHQTRPTRWLRRGRHRITR